MRGQLYLPSEQQRLSKRSIQIPPDPRENDQESFARCEATTYRTEPEEVRGVGVETCFFFRTSSRLLPVFDPSSDMLRPKKKTLRATLHRSVDRST